VGRQSVPAFIPLKKSSTKELHCCPLRESVTKTSFILKHQNENIQTRNRAACQCHCRMLDFSLIQEIFKITPEGIFKSLILIKINVSWPNYSIQSNASLELPYHG
jgi:hypothetical protein